MKTCYACGGQAVCVFAYYGGELTYACDRHDPLTPPTMTTGGMSYYRRPIAPEPAISAEPPVQAAVPWMNKFADRFMQTMERLANDPHVGRPGCR